MAKHGHCSSCNKTFALEDRVMGKVIGTGLAALVTAIAGKDTRKAPLLFAGLNLAGLAIGHALDGDLRLRCQTPGCTTILNIVDAVVA